jgi:hypothetical protein
MRFQLNIKSQIHRLFLATKVHKGSQRKKTIETIPMKSFWKSRNLFSKRFLAAGGKVVVDLGNINQRNNK